MIKPDYQLEVAVDGTIEFFEVVSRFVADDSLSTLKMHRVGPALTIRSPVESSLQNNCIVLGVKFLTY